MKLGVVAHAYNLSMWKVEAGRPVVQSHLQLYGEFKASLEVYETLSQKQKTLNFDTGF